MTVDVAINAMLTDGVYAIGGVLPIDASIPWLPAGVTGYEPCLVYLLEGKSRSVLVDTGLPIFRSAILSRLRGLLAPRHPLSVVVTRPEADCVGNLGAIVEEFPVERILGFSTNPLEFFPESIRRAGRVVYERRRLGESWEWDEGRMLQLLPAPFGLLITGWPYDVKTGTLFTSDTFGWTHLPGPDASCWADAAMPATAGPVVEAHLRCRFHWLPACRPEAVERALGRIFEERPVRIIAPSRGRVVRGEASVRAQYGVVRQAVRGIRAGTTDEGSKGGAFMPVGGGSGC